MRFTPLEFYRAVVYRQYVRFGCVKTGSDSRRPERKEISNGVKMREVWVRLRPVQNLFLFGIPGGPTEFLTKLTTNSYWLIFMKGDKNKTSNKKILAIFLLIMAIGIASYYYLPIGKSLAEQTKALMILALNGTKEQVRGFIDNKILPKNPEEQRKVLINELKNNLNQLKNKISPATTIVSGGGKSSISNPNPNLTNNSNNSVANFIDNSEKLINQLEAANQNRTITQNAAERILDVILPIKEKTVDCNKL